MSDVVIRAEGLGKRYRIGRHEAPYKTLRESLTGMALAPARKLRALARGEPWRREPETIWALKDVDLEVRQGEVLGIIGRNGAGKSTLLKILARVTEPTTGRVELRGRIGSLLEVGTGFHPELTGRENIYLNGAILGMRKAEIDRRFDEIVSFAEIERFLDTPVKRYSSGMYVRLAFAVAAHMEPEILLVDEVLAVGDAAFQKKCLGKIGAVAGEGRTVLLISHNLTVVIHTCGRAAILSHGRLGPPQTSRDAISEYLSGNMLNHYEISNSVPKHNLGKVTIERVSSCSDNQIPSNAFLAGENFAIKVDIFVHTEPKNLALELGFYDSRGILLAFSSTQSLSRNLHLSKGQHVILCRILDPPIWQSTIRLNCAVISTEGLLAAVEDACQFFIVKRASADIPRVKEPLLLVSSEWKLIKK